MLPALAAGIGAGVGSIGSLSNFVIGNSFVGGAISGTIGNVLTQGVEIATGLQKHFDWAGDAVGAVAGGIASGVSTNIGGAATQFTQATQVNLALSGAAAAIAGAATRSLATGSDFGDNIISALPDVIGSTIGNLVANGIQRAAADAVRTREQQASSATSQSGKMAPATAGDGGPPGSYTTPDGIVVSARRYGLSILDAAIYGTMPNADGVGVQSITLPSQTAPRPTNDTSDEIVVTARRGGVRTTAQLNLGQLNTINRDAGIEVGDGGKFTKAQDTYRTTPTLYNTWSELYASRQGYLAAVEAHGPFKNSAEIESGFRANVDVLARGDASFVQQGKDFGILYGENALGLAAGEGAGYLVGKAAIAVSPFIGRAVSQATGRLLGTAADTAPIDIAANEGAWARAAAEAKGPYSLVGGNRAVIDPRKLTDYALSPAHPVGGNKARVFESAFGFNVRNADDLMLQLRKGVMETPATIGKIDQYGTRFTVDIPVTGPTGSGVVRTGWIYRPGSNTPELTTLFPK